MNRVEGTGAVLQRINALELDILALESVDHVSCSQGDWHRNRMMLHVKREELLHWRELLDKLTG